MDVPNGKYVVRIKSKKQSLEHSSIWKLRFKQYYENSLSFESMYTYKTSSLSSIDQTLLKYHEIDYYSTKEAILTLQKKLQQKGCWDDTVKVKDSRGIVKTNTNDRHNKSLFIFLIFPPYFSQSLFYKKYYNVRILTSQVFCKNS